jgi:uncharacterized membrane protein
MEIPLIITLLVLVLVAFPIWAIVKILALSRENEAIASQLYSLERDLKEVRDKLASVTSAPRVDPTPLARPAAPSITAIPPPAPASPDAARGAAPIVVPHVGEQMPRPVPTATPPPLPAVNPAPAFLQSATPPPLVEAEPIAYVRPPQPSFLKKIDWEQFMGAKLFAWLGGLAALLGVAFFVKYSFEHDLIPPEVRVALGFLFGAALIVGGLKLDRSRYAVGAQTLIATGIVSLYAVTFACNSVYHFAFFGPIATFLLMSLVTAAAFLLAVRLDARVVAILGMLGGFLTPVLLSTGHDNPPGLFGYIALLDVGLIAVALHRRWHVMFVLAATGTVIMQFGWASKFLNAEKSPTAMVVCLAFTVLFLGGYFVARRLGRRSTEAVGAAVAFPAVALAFAFAFLFYPAIAARPGLLFTFVLAADVALLALAWFDEALPRLHLAAGGAAFALLAVWTATRLTEALLPWALAFYLLHAVLHTAFPLVLQRHRPDAAPTWWSQLFPPLALLLMFGPLVKLDTVSLLFWPCVLLIDVIAIALALFTASLTAVAVVLVLTLVATGLWIFQVPATVSAEPALLLVLGGFAVLFFGAGLFVARRLGDRLRTAGDATSSVFGDVRAQIPAFSALLPFLLLIMMTQRLPLENPSPIFGLALLLVVLTLGLAAILSLEWLPACALAGVAALEYAWQARHATSRDPALSLGWFVLFYAVFAAYPFAFRQRFAKFTGPWAVAALVGLAQFLLVYRTVERSWPNQLMGLLPAAFAVAPMLSLIAVLRLGADAERPRLNRLAWFGGVALFFITLIFPIQFERQWITIGWALEGVALLWLFHRVPHPGLRGTGAVLLVAAFARLALNPAVLAYHARSDTAIFNWYLYSYGLAIACLFVGARQVAPPRDMVFGVKAPTVFNTLGTILAFLLLNIEIADYFSEPGGQALVFQFSGNFARDMTYTIAWALFALGLLLVSMWKDVRVGRYAAMALLAVALLKLFFHDLARLEALYRIGALFAVAVIATVASFAYQRFLPGAAPKNEPPAL